MSKRGRRVFVLLPLIVILLLGVSITGFAQEGTPQRGDGTVDPAFAGQIERLRDSGIALDEQLTARPFVESTLPTGQLQVNVQLMGEPAALVFARAGGQGGGAGALAAAQAQASNLASEQAQFISSLPSFGVNAQVLAQTRYVVNMVTLVVNAADVETLRARPDVRSIHPVVYFERATSSSMPNIGAPSAWNGSLGGQFLGQGVVISVIDDGVDYTHRHFGGNGDFSLSATFESRTVIGDDPNFPGPKVIGGYDFAGDLYSWIDPFPTPDPDPQTCPITEGFTGHGTHVAGIAAGYGVKANGETFGNPSESYSNLPPNMLIGPGAAPLAQVLAMKVFGCEGSTADFLVVQAIDASVSGQYGGPANVINMSLGRAYGGGHGNPDRSIYVTAVNSAVAAGVTVVASAGNNYDTWFIHGSPGSTPAIISVASTSDGGEDGILIDGNPTVARDSFNPPLTIVGPAGFTYLPGNGCTAAQWTGFPANSFAVLNWTGACGSIAIANAAVQATPNLPLGILIANNVPVALQNLACNSTTPGAPYIPCVSIQQSTGQLLAANPSAQITFDPSVKTINTPAVDTISTFSSRGPASFSLDGLGPDIAAPGDVVTSAGAGTGFEPYNLGGTSMAAPTVAGVVALMYSNPFYANVTPYQMKALLMNTANNDVYLGNNETGPRIGVQRMGAGRVNVVDAMSNQVIVYNRLRPEHVAVNFLYPEVTFGQTATFTRQVRVQNLGTQTATYNLSFDTYTNANIAQFSVSPTTVTVGPRASVDVTVTLTVDTTVANTQNFSDLSVAATQGGLVRHFLSEEAANLILTPVSGATVPLRLPVYAAPRATSEMFTVNPVAADGGLVGTAIATVQGTPLDDPGPTLREAPTSLASVFQLVGTDAVGDTLTPAPNADIQYVGVASNYLWGGSNPDGSWNANGVVWIAISTAGDWNTPQNTIFDIYLDTNMNGSFDDPEDVNIYNWTITANNTRTDVHVSVAGRLSGPFFLHEFINGYSANINTYAMNNNVMFLAFYPTLGNALTTAQFNMYIDAFDRESGAYVDTTPVFTVDLANPVIDTWAQLLLGDALILDTPGYPIFLDYNLWNYDLSQGIPTALVMHHHNDSNTTNPTTNLNFRRAELVYLDVNTVDLELYKYTSDGEESYPPGSTFSYTLEVFGFSQGDSVEFLIEDVLAPDLTFISASPQCSHSGEAQGGTVVCLDTISSNETKFYEITVTINPLFVGTISNTAELITNAIDTFPDDNVSTVVISVPPLATTITAPSGSTSDNTPLFVWDAVNGSEWYQLFVSSGGVPVFNQWFDAAAVCSGATCSVDAGVVHPAGNYEAVVQTWHPTGGFGPFSNTTFYTVTTPPDAPTLIAPLGDITETNPLFTFSREDAGWYQIWVTNNTAGGVLVHQDVYDASLICGATECAIDASLNLGAGSYTWWVRGWNQWGLYGDWSSAGNFNVVIAPITPTPIAPIGTIGTGMPTFQWTESPTATWYEIWVSDGVTGFNQWYDQSVICSGGTCSVTPGLNLTAGFYSWWVRAWSPLGGYSAWSAETMFTVAIPPTAPTLIAPQGDVSTSNPLFVFQRDSSATWFYLWLSDGANPVLVDWFDGAAICTGTSCSIDAGLDLAAGNYLWWLQAWSPIGGYSTWSGPMIFNVVGGGGGGAETTPEPLAPVDPTAEPTPVDEVTPEPTPTEEVTPEPTETPTEEDGESAG